MKHLAPIRKELAMKGPASDLNKLGFRSIKRTSIR